ncbi:LuxR C-terminal-related transcriptional regulator [Streptomyces sp. NPDC000351]|uniref:LuxR C-terminal-related transcriptional regulator n=1 Tax=Streptomyces sp. NPDC000351 TaxID=3154250 RepID=UPI0033249E09
MNLTDHELRVLRLVAQGSTHQEIADELVMTAKGVTPTVNRAIRKLGARNAPHAVHLAHLAGILRRERHGDHAGFTAHVRRGEDPWACTQGCPEGERAYRAGRRQQRKEAA